MKRLLALISIFVVITAAVVDVRADVSFVQIVQSQTSQGDDGLFGKVWIEVSGRKMRLVSGFAGKVSSGRRGKTAEPARFVQILDLDTTSLIVLNPSSKTYEARALGDLRYADSLHLHVPENQPDFALIGSTVSVEKGELRRPCLDMECEHFHILVELKLRGPDGKTTPARMAQDVWMAPIAGARQKLFLDLISFEAAYRKLTQDAFTPLDYETYQVREAAAYLHVPRRQLAEALAQVKRVFIDIPGYPMSSSVSWWRQDRAGTRPPAVKRPSLAVRWLRRRPARPVFKPINWHYSFNSINRAMGGRRALGERFPLGPLKPPRIEPQAEYVEFRREMTSVVEALLLAEPRREKVEPSRARASPFYEIFAETKELEFLEALPPGDFLPPADYKKL